MSLTNRRILLQSRPAGKPGVDNFLLVETPVPELADGQVLVKHHWLSLDPYMRGRMNEGKSYAQPQPLGEVMIGGTAGEVVASRNPQFAVGDKVVGMGGWQEYAIVSADQRGVLQKVDTSRVPLSAYLGPVGMPGVTGWYGLSQIIEPKAGETVVVSAASGAVGGIVGQLARRAAAARSASPAGPTNAATSPASSASTPASTTRRSATSSRSRRRSRPPARTASTATSRMSAGRSWMR